MTMVLNKTWLYHGISTVIIEKLLHNHGIFTNNVNLNTVRIQITIVLPWDIK